jgi:glycosyltransferase involved in cell wall biosynthesis
MPIPLSYVPETQRGISNARNRAVSSALSRKADFVAFIDDDDLPRRDWLEALVSTQADTNADIVFGAWTQADSAPSWSKGGDKLESDGSRRKDVIFGKSQLPMMASTCNVLIGAGIFRRMAEDGEWFRQAFNDAGGEDKDFFLRSLDYEAVHAQALDSIIIRRHEDERQMVRGLMRRGFKNGSSRIMRLRKHNRGGKAALSGIFYLLKLILVALTLPFCIFSGDLFNEQLYRLGKSAGAVYSCITNRSARYYLDERGC